jgi:YVTN family beta-propeller protein
MKSNLLNQILKLKNSLIPLCFIIVLILSVTYLTSCEQDFVTPGETSTFPDSIAQLFSTPYNSTNNTCASVSCHNSASRAGGLDLVNWQDAMNGSNQGTMIIPYNGFWSHITAVVNNDTNVSPVVEILPTIHKMDDPNKISMLMNWMNAGAPDKNGNIAFNSISNPCFITNQASDNIAVVNTSSRLVTRLIPVGGRTQQLDAPHYVTSDYQNRYIYVSLIQEGYVEKYDAYSYAQVGRRAVGLNPAHIVISTNNLYGYVSNFDASGQERSVKKFDANTMQVLDTVSDQRMNAPHGMATSTDGQFLYVSSQLGEYVFKIDLSTFEIIAAVPIGPGVPPNGNGSGLYKPYQIILSSDNSKLFVTCTAEDAVRVFNTSDMTPYTTPRIQVGDNPLLMKFSRNNQYIFVCNRNSNTVSVIEGSSYSVIKTIDSVGIQPHGVDFTVDGQYAIIACETLSGFDGHHPTIGSNKPGVSRIIRMSDLTIETRRLEMSSFPAGIVIFPFYY